jgi:hypothetical protein
MKTQKLIFAAAVAALAFAHFASAQINIYISGAPATRRIWNTAIVDTLNAYGGGATLSEYYTGSAGFAAANQIAVLGGNISGTSVNIYASWDGSTSGNQSVANTPPATISNFQVGFINTSGLSPGSVSSSSTTTLAYPEINLSDTKQNSLPFNGTTNVTSPTTSYVALTEAATTSPAVTGYIWVANEGAPSSLTNITTNLARQLFTSYYGVPLAFFSASVSDTTTIVYPVGRDIGSGSRYIMDAETGIGTAKDDTVIQFTPTYSSGTLSNIVDNPSAGGTINDISFNEGDGGYPSTSAIEAALNNTSIPSIGYIIGYLSDSDANSSSNHGVNLSWNGVPYSVAGIQLGQYTFWSYLHVYYNNTNNYLQNLSPIAVTFANYLASDLASDSGLTSLGAIFSSTLKVSRQNDGALVAPNYTIP